MRSKHFVMVTVVAAISVGMTAWGMQQRGGATRGQQSFKLTTWPANSPDRPYIEIVEQHLNKMASQGWHYDGEMSGEGARMIVFRKEE